MDLKIVDDKKLQREEKRELKKETEKIKKILGDVSENDLSIYDGLIQNTAFMALELKKLQETIKSEGTVGIYPYGKDQEGKKESPEFKAYITLSKTYISSIKELKDIINPQTEKKEENPLFEFINITPKVVR